MGNKYISPHLSALLKRMRIKSDTIKELTDKVFEKAVQEDRVRKDEGNNIVIVTTKTRSSKLWKELLGNDNFKIGKKKPRYHDIPNTRLDLAYWDWESQN